MNDKTEISVGDTFVIEVAEISELADGRKKYFIKPFESLVFDDRGLMMLERFDTILNAELAKAEERGYNKGLEDGKKYQEQHKEPTELDYDTYETGFNKGMECCWEMSKKLILSPEDGGISNTLLRDLFQSSNYNLLKNNDVHYVYNKLYQNIECQYPLTFGDEIFRKSDPKFKAVIINIQYRQDTTAEFDCADCIDHTGRVIHIMLDEWSPTGKHYEEVETLLGVLISERSEESVIVDYKQAIENIKQGMYIPDKCKSIEAIVKMANKLEEIKNMVEDTNASENASDEMVRTQYISAEVIREVINDD